MLGCQLTEAYAWAQKPRYIIRDRDGAYGEVLIQRLRAMGIRDRPISPRSPWQNGHSERLIGSIRRDCLDHVIVFGERVSRGSDPQPARKADVQLISGQASAAVPWLL